MNVSLRLWTLTLALLALLGLSFHAEAASKFISIGTAKIGGTWYPLGAGLADVLGPALPGISISVEETAGADENARRVVAGDMEIGFTVARTALAMHKGEAPYQGMQDKARAWFSLENRYQTSLALESSGIKTAADIKGKRVGIGIQGSANYFDGKIWLWGHGIELEDVKPFFMGQAELAAALKDGRIDVMLWTTGIPSAAIQELCLSRPITFIPTTPEAAAKISAAYPYYKAVTLPAKTYQSMTESSPTMLNNSLLLISSALSDDTVYAMTKAVFDNLGKLGNVHPVFKELSLDNAITTTPIPLHPGALRFFKEKKAASVERFLP